MKFMAKVLSIMARIKVWLAGDDLRLSTAGVISSGQSYFGSGFVVNGKNLRENLKLIVLDTRSVPFLIAESLD